MILKVLHLITSLSVGGAEEVVKTVVTGLDPSRFRVVAATLEDLGAIGEELRSTGYTVINLGLSVKRTPFFRLLRAVRRLLKEEQPHILHTHLYHPNLYGRLAALGLGLKGVVASVHNSYTRVKLHRCLWNFLLARLSHRVLVSSPQVWQDVRTWDRVPPAKLVVFPYGIDLGALDPPLSREAARQELGVRGFVLGLVGRLEEQKGHRHLLAALPELLQEIPELTVMLVGEGRLGEALRAQARELQVADRVRFLGTRRDLPRLFRAMDLLVHPSLWEGLPLTLLMAMGAGLPVVATRVSGVVEVMADGVNGRLVPPGDRAALKSVIVELYRQPERRRALAARARETVAAAYSREAMLRRLEHLYLEMVQG
jgi:glycosyltransferase involved in cell wall biosynthesis